MPVPVEFSLVTNAETFEELQPADAEDAPVLLGTGSQTVWYAPAVIGKLGEFVRPVT
jgi:hypothetical protein